MRRPPPCCLSSIIFNSFLKIIVFSQPVNEQPIVATDPSLRVFLPGTEGYLTWVNYYKFRDVNRVPKALRRIHNALTKNHGGILSLDTDLPDTYMNSVFMMDYLVETSGFKLVHLNECISRSQ